MSDYCGPCRIVGKDEHSQNVAYLLCDCGPGGSKVPTEHPFDLGA